MKLTTQSNKIPAIDSVNTRFAFIEKKWTSDRLRKLDQVSELFNSEPDRVEIFSDAKFGSDPLILTKKSNLDNLIKLFRDLTTGQAVIKHNIDTLVDAIAIIKSRVEEKNIDDIQIAKTLNILGSASSQIITEILVSGEPKSIETSSVTLNELKGLPED